MIAIYFEGAAVLNTQRVIVKSVQRDEESTHSPAQRHATVALL